MKINKEQPEKNVVTLEITVEAEKFDEALVKSYRKNVKQIAIPGFRKGKAPKKMIEKVYGESIFYEDAMDYIFEDTYPNAIEESEIEPVSRPEIDIKQIGEGKDFIYTAKVYVKPEVTIGNYDGIEVEKVEYAVTDEDVELEIKNMMEKVSRFVDVTDKPIEDGNVAVIDFEGFVDGTPFEGGKGENHNLTIGSGQFIPGFEEQLIGKNLGEECDVNVTFPEEYHAENLAGKDATFKVKINGIKMKEYPPLDDEFAKDVSEFDTLEQLREETKKRLMENAAKRSEREQNDNVLKAVSDITEIDIPQPMIDTQIEEYIQDMKYRIQMQMPGITFEQYLQYTGGTLEQFKESMKERAQYDVKVRLMLEKISKDENLEATAEEIETEVEKIAEQYKMEVEKVKELLKQNGIDNIKDDIVVKKAIDLLKEKVKLVEKA